MRKGIGVRQCAIQHKTKPPRLRFVPLPCPLPLPSSARPSTPSSLWEPRTGMGNKMREHLNIWSNRRWNQHEKSTSHGGAAARWNFWNQKACYRVVSHYATTTCGARERAGAEMNVAGEMRWNYYVTRGALETHICPKPLSLSRSSYPIR